MWQRFKEVVDTAIEKETAKTRSPSQNSPRTRPRAGSRPIRRPGDDNNRLNPTGKTPDPSEFDDDFTTGSNSEVPSRIGTPLPRAALDPSPIPQENGTDEKNDDSEPSPVAIPLEAQQRLRRLDRLEPKYKQLVASYKIAHARAIVIDSFESALKEHTPLQSITDIAAFVEFIQQQNLKASMVTDELRKTVTERDELKQKLQARETEANKIPDSQIKKTDDESEDFFSLESEIPRLQEEAKHNEEKLDLLQKQVESLKNELKSSQSSESHLEEQLENTSAELRALKTTSQNTDDNGELNLKFKTLEKELESVKKIVEIKTEEIKNHEATIKVLEEQQISTREAESKVKLLGQKNGKLEKELTDARESISLEEKRNATLNVLVQNLRSQVKASSPSSTPQPTTTANTTGLKAETSISSTIVEATNGDTTTGGKKKKNKKKKGSKATDASDQPVSDVTDTTEIPAVDNQESLMVSDDRYALLQKELESLHALCEDKDVTIIKLQAKVKDQEGLQEEIETLRDDIIHHGQETVEAKDQIKKLEAEKTALGQTISKLENEAIQLREQQTLHSGTTQAHEILSTDFRDLKIKSDKLETDLAAADKLAASRFTEVSDMRERLQRTHQELQTLRTESSTLKKAKEDLVGKTTEVKKLEGREKDLRNEVSRIKKQLTDRDSDIRSLNEKLSQASTGKKEAEESLRKAQKDVQRCQAEKIEALDNKEMLTKDLTKSQDELRTSRFTLQKLESQVQKLSSDIEALKDEITLKTAQYASAQSLMNSMQDQSSELGTQMKEMRERCESLEEELADAHRLLSERSREGEKLRRLAAEAEGRAESRIKEMRDQMDIAVEERDRAEEQASTMGRKRSRELDELKTKVRDAELSLRRVEQEKEELEMTQRDIQRQKDEIEKRASRTNDELTEVRETMTQLRDALDDTERQARELEKEKSSLKQNLDESQNQLDKIQKSSKLLNEEIKTMKQHQKQHKQQQQSSRSSIESARSPTPRNATVSPVGSTFGGGGNGSGGGKVDYVYLKNVLLQFLEQKDKKHQMSLIPVLSTLLQFDKHDEQKWISAIRTP